MKIKSALIVYKKSSYQKMVLEEKSSYYNRLVRENNISVRQWKQLHKEHLATIKRVEACLQEHGIPFKAYNRFKIRLPVKADLIITVGGDGTFLESSHYATNQILFGVNSTPTSSVGHFTAVHGVGFEKKFKQFLAGRARLKTLQRLQAHCGRTKLGPPVLNEILFTSRNAGATSRYWMRVNKGARKGRFEEQKSSGIWVSTPSGSTAAIHSAGGKRLPMEANKFSYRIRELYKQRGIKHLYRSDVLGPKDAIQLTAKMDDGALFIDGSHVIIKVRRGETLTFKLSTKPLRIVA